MQITNEMILKHVDNICAVLKERFPAILEKGEIQGEDGEDGRRFMAGFHSQGTSLAGKGREPFSLNITVTIIAKPNE